MLEIEICESIKMEASNKAEKLGILKKSILQGKGNSAGIVGEIVVRNYIGATQEESYDYDLSKDGITYDVKTKQVTTTPKPNYECSIAEYQLKQDCDRYVFTRVNLSDNTCWILGWINKDEFFEKAKLIKQSEVDQSNGWQAKVSCYNLPISELKDIDII